MGEIKNAYPGAICIAKCLNEHVLVGVPGVLDFVNKLWFPTCITLALHLQTP